MAGRARTPRSGSRILGCSSVLRFLRSLVGSKSRSKSSNKSLARNRPSLSQEQDAVSPRMGRQGGRWRREPRLRAMAPRGLSAASAAPSNLPLNDGSRLGTGDTGSQTLTSRDALNLESQDLEVTSVPTRGTEEVLGQLSEKKEEEEPAEEASGASGASDREHAAQALDAEQGCRPWVPEPPALSPGAFAKEEEEGHCLIEIGDLMLNSCKSGSTPWNYLLGLYKQLHKSAMAKFPLKDSLAHEEKGEREVEEEDSLRPSPPRLATCQSPLQKTFRFTDTVGFVESELKKILAVQRESRLWKVDSLGTRELLTRPDITLEEAGMVDGQHLLLEETDDMGNWPPPE